MLKIFLSEVTEWGWIQWMFFLFMVSGTCSQGTVHQPPVLTAALGHDAIMPCQLILSDNVKMVIPPVLYWAVLPQESDDDKLWPPSENYKERVDLLDKDLYSPNKSVLFRNVQWADSGRYQCKVSITTKDGRFRRLGNTSLLVVHDTMTFNLSGHNDSLLRCEVNVTHNPGFVLTIFHDGYKLETGDSSASGDSNSSLHFVTLSEAVLLSSDGTYECQLHLNEDLVTTSIFDYHLPVAEEPKDAGKNVSATVQPDKPVEYKEPWHLYIALLLVPTIVLLVLLTALLIRRD
ncbi:uncharacterized protein LOC119006140 isoform X1 [Acanthopagrus latus]|uniref:uncharacterized protein LOC119006140 isoform X1 n=1 Tax=Acanthopagrus latus TaxID=8177 RepID=UPI00187CC6F1|nr:uncharacterized protein LOC119006140 isoform X1 [Acanthopagrus latus]